jgi:hypothetical protein
MDQNLIDSLTAIIVKSIELQQLNVAEINDLVTIRLTLQHENAAKPKPIGWIKSSEWNDALVKKQSANVWRHDYGDCDLVFFINPVQR